MLCRIAPEPRKRWAGRGTQLLRQTGGAQSAGKGKAPYPSITFEDELYARTVRTIHCIAVHQHSINDVYSLLELRNANGALISFDHSGQSEFGGVLTWLEAGACVFMAQMRERARNPLMVSLFPRGTPFGGMGDGSTDRSLNEQEAVVLRFLGSDGRPFNTFFDLAELDLTTSHDGRRVARPMRSALPPATRPALKRSIGAMASSTTRTGNRHWSL